MISADVAQAGECSGKSIWCDVLSTKPCVVFMALHWISFVDHVYVFAELL